MKTVMIIALAFLVVRALPCAASTTNAPSTNAVVALPGQPGMTETAIVRVADFTDSGRVRLVWIVTFQKKDGNVLKCIVRDDHPFLKATGLDKMRPVDLGRKTDFSELPWFKITVGPGTKEMGQLLTWEELKDGAEQSAAPLPSAPQTGPAEGAR
jgi:hypothetical protein